MALSLRVVRRAEAAVREQDPDLSGAEFDAAVEELLHDWAVSAAHDREVFGDPEDTPALEDGRDNCNDWGTGEGQFHGRIG